MIERSAAVASRYSRAMRLSIVLTLLFSSSVALAAPNDWAEGTEELNDGASREYYNRGAQLLWRNMLGDWHDRSGVAQGTEAWARTIVEDTNTPRFVEWDVTALVAAWVTDEVQNQGFLLRSESGSTRIVTREASDASLHPQLVVNGAALAVAADTYTEPSTFRPRGSLGEMRVGGANNGLLRFDLSGIATVESATLRVYTTEQYGTTDIGVFRASPGHQGEPPPRELGLAAEYEGDEGIASHPDVIFFDAFEAPDWADEWREVSGEYETTDDPSFGFAPLSGRALRSVIPEGENSGLNIRYPFEERTGSEPDQAYFRYYIRLGSTWDQTVDGGKLPGFAGTYGVAGWGGRRPDGTDGWSARGLFGETVPTGRNPLGGATPVGNYYYHADQPGTFGDNRFWTESFGREGHGGVLERERWYCLEQYVQMNTPGEPDGVIRAWVDGRLAFEKTDLRFRLVDTLHIELVWMNIYHGGTAVSPADQHTFIDNVVIARRYIGPMGSGAEPDAGPSDAGTDAGEDAGADAGGDLDAGTDAGDARDAGTDASDASDDAGADTGPGATSDDGCGCSARSGRSNVASIAFALLCLARRRS